MRVASRRRNARSCVMKKSVGFDAQEEFLQPEDGGEIEMIGRLVQQQDVGQPGQRARQQHAPLHAAGKRGEFRRGGQLHLLHQLLQPHVGLPVLLVPATRRPPWTTSCTVPASPAGTSCGSREMTRLAGREISPSCGCLLAGHEAHERGLARAVAADEADALARVDLEIGAVEQRGGGIAERDVAKLEKRHGSRPP